jgi:hypothetical protein
MAQTCGRSAHARVGDLADFQAVIEGTRTLEQLRSAGVNTEVKRFRVTSRGDRELELHDRAGDDAVDSLMAHTALRPADLEKNVRLNAGQATETVVQGVVMRGRGAAAQRRRAHDDVADRSTGVEAIAFQARTRAAG